MDTTTGRAGKCEVQAAHRVMALVWAAALAGCGARVDVESDKQDQGQDHATAASFEPPANAAVSAQGNQGSAALPSSSQSAGSQSAASQPAGSQPVIAVTSAVASSSVIPLGPGDDPLAAVPVPSDQWIDLNELDELDVDGGAEFLAAPTDAGSEFTPGDLTLLVILDNSGSMDTAWHGESRWTVANRTLIEALWPVRDLITVGAIRFPLETQCGVPSLDSGLQFGFTSGTKFVDAWLANAFAAGGGTPLAQAFQVADRVIREAGSETGLDRGRRFRVMVLTDGEPNCEGDPSLLESLPAGWRELGIDTHVIGLPGSQAAADLLNRISAAGGTESYYTADDHDGFSREVTSLAR